ncbi:MAG: hypothetical protein JNM57_11265 [Cyclobacteriaceae bacterium]|nr:hypothetical protein [Cyclobacteriaceae bacterium]
MKKVRFLVVVLSALLLGCKSDYEKMVAKELAKNVRYDSLFLDLHFGMTRKDFFTHCWELNKKGTIMQGPGNLSVQYQVDSTLMKDKTFMWFYPDFKDDKITSMPVEFSYQSWAPWNQELSADTLLMEVKQLYEKWYGDGFVEMKNKDGSKVVWIKVDGNRRIRLFKKNISIVHADFTNLLEVEKTKDKPEE